MSVSTTYRQRICEFGRLLRARTLALCSVAAIVIAVPVILPSDASAATTYYKTTTEWDQVYWCDSNGYISNTDTGYACQDRFLYANIFALTPSYQSVPATRIKLSTWILWCANPSRCTQGRAVPYPGPQTGVNLYNLQNATWLNATCNLYGGGGPWSWGSYQRTFSCGAWKKGWQWLAGTNPLELEVFYELTLNATDCPFSQSALAACITYPFATYRLKILSDAVGKWRTEVSPKG